MMPRVCVWYEASGRERYNTSRATIPFTLMVNVGDWCHVERGPKCLAGNVAGLCSAYSRKFCRRFEFKDLNNGLFLIKVTGEAVRPKPKARRRRKAITGQLSPELSPPALS